MLKKQKKKNPYQSVRNMWTRKPQTQVKGSDKAYKRSKAKNELHKRLVDDL